MASRLSSPIRGEIDDIHGEDDNNDDDNNDDDEDDDDDDDELGVVWRKRW